MRLDDVIFLHKTSFGYDDNMNVTETEEILNVGKCKVLPNTSAGQIKCNDGQIYQYSYTIILRNPNTFIEGGDFSMDFSTDFKVGETFQAIPQEGDMISVFHKLSGKTFKQRVIGVTYLPKKYFKIYI